VVVGVISASSAIHVGTNFCFPPFSLNGLSFATLPAPLLLFPLQSIPALRFSSSFAFPAIAIFGLSSLTCYHLVVLAATLRLKPVSLDLRKTFCFHELASLILLALQLSLTALIFITTAVFVSAQIVVSAELFAATFILRCTKVIFTTPALYLFSAQIIFLLLLRATSLFSLILALLLLATLTGIPFGLLLGEVETHVALRARWAAVAILSSHDGSCTSCGREACNSYIFLPRGFLNR
jgi:hypothetical protein